MRRLVILFAALLAFATPAFAADRLVVFAAASLKTALDAAAAPIALGAAAKSRSAMAARFALARQIVAGAPADVFASADEELMDEAVKGGAIRAGTRFDLLSNRLVVVAPKSSAIDALALDREALAKAIGDGRLATGEVNTVPIGRYAKASLIKLGLWEVVEPHLAMTDNVRAALAFVARGEARLGIVYATDAAAEPGVKIVATIPDDSHPPITYPFAITAASHNERRRDSSAFSNRPPRAQIFKAQGFGVIAP